MPRVILTEQARADAAFLRIMDTKRAAAGIPTWANLADRLSVERNTFYTWRRNPGSIPARQLRQIYRVLHYTAQDIYDSCGLK